MVCCLNPHCPNPENPDNTKFCQSCGVKIVPLLLNRFQVVKVIGQGGFGRTYLAKDTHKFDEFCVVKQLVPHTQGTWAINKTVELFKQEAKQLQQLGKHPHIPALYAYFQQDDYLYLVQQFIPGQDLAQELQHRGIWQEEEIKELLQEILPVIQFIHKNGIIHRDIKPANIMRCQGSIQVGKTGNLVLIDFGISKQLSNTILTTTQGTMIGSCGYAAIEQMKLGEAYPASDLFSLGATCFHLLTNVCPSDLFLEEGYGWTNNWRNHLQTKVSDELSQVLNRLLHKDIAKRYQSAEEVIKDIPIPVVSVATPTIPYPPLKYQLKSGQTIQPSLPPGKSNLIGQIKTIFLQSKLILLITLLAFLGTQLYGWNRYGLSPIKQVFLLTSLRSNFFLKETLLGHSDTVGTVVFSPDGKMLVSGSKDNTVKLWDVVTTQEITTFKRYLSSVNTVVFSPEGNTLFTGSGGGKIKFLNLKKQENTATIKAHSGIIFSLVISSDGKTLASGSGDGTIKFWDVENKQEIASFERHSGIIFSVAFSPDGKTLASGSSDSTIKLWDVENKQEIATLTSHSRPVWSAIFSPNGKILASGGGDGTIRLWDVETRQKIGNVADNLFRIRALAFSPNGKILASSGLGKTIKLWNVETKTEIATFTGHKNNINSLTFSPDGKILASGSDDKTVKLWRIP